MPLLRIYVKTENYVRRANEGIPRKIEADSSLQEKIKDVVDYDSVVKIAKKSWIFDCC